MICEYGCGKEGKFFFKEAGKWCCSKYCNSCPEMRRKNKEKKLGKKLPHTKEWNKNISKARKGKGKGKNLSPRPKEWGRKISKTKKERKQRPSILAIIKSVEKRKGIRGYWKDKKRGLQNEEFRRKKSISKKLWWENHPEEKEKQSKYMKNGGAVYIQSFIKDDSKPENELFILACKLLPKPIQKYPIYRGKKRNYNADIADSSLGIILEYDGWYHFCDQEHIDYHNKRQQEIEEDGWKFLRYNIFQKFPTLQQVKEDIKKILE